MNPKLNRTAIFVMLLAAACGCATVSNTPQGDHPPGARVELSPSTGENAPAIDQPKTLILHTRLPTDAAGQAVDDCFQNFGFNVSPAGGDYFYRAMHANTANGYTLEATFRWKKDGDTEITFISNMEQSEYDYVLAAMKQSIADRESGKPPASPVLPPALSAPRPPG